MPSHNNNGRINRRQTLRSLGGLGVSGFAFQSPKSMNDGTTEIITVRQGSRVLERKQVPSRWWDQMTRARKVRHHMARDLLSSDSVEDVRLEAGEKMTSDCRRGVVAVYLSPDRNLDRDAPNEVDGVDIKYQKYDPGGQPLNGEEDPVPGGVQLWDDRDRGEFSSGCRLQTSDLSEEFLLTCAHAVDACSTDPTGVPIYQPSDIGNNIGQVKKYNVQRDYTIIERTNDDTLLNGYSDQIKDADFGPIKGRVTEDGVCDLVGSDKTVYKIGDRTGETTGVVDGMYACDSLDCVYDICSYVTATMETKPGDSGAPYFVKKIDPTTKEPYAAVVAIHKGRDSWGSAAYEIYDHNNGKYIFS